MAYSNQHEAFEALLKSALPGVPVFQANMPFLKMDELARAEAKTATYLFYKDTERVNTSSASGKKRYCSGRAPGRLQRRKQRALNP